MNALVLLLVLTTSTLVLRSGDRIDVEGPVRENGGVVTFKRDGVLYSLPADEVDLEATRQADQAKVEPVEKTEKKVVLLSETPLEEEPEPRKLRVSAEERQRLLAALAANHEGTPAPSEQLHIEPVREKSKDEERTERDEELLWRERTSDHVEAIRRAEEEVDLLKARVEELRNQIQTFFLAGYKPSQFTYQTTQLELTLQQIPRAELEVERARRELETMRENARRARVPSHWVR
jgi:hypothetical protein